jgi:hypothetical protein
MIKTVMERLLLLCGCSFVVTVLLSYEFSRGLLSPRGLGAALLMVCIAIGVGVVLIIKKSAKELPILLGPHGTPIDPGTRKLLLRVIRRAKIRIATMGVLLVLGVGLPEIRDVPVWALLVALAMNLLIIATSVQTVVRLQKTLRSPAA